MIIGFRENSSNGPTWKASGFERPAWGRQPELTRPGSGVGRQGHLRRTMLAIEGQAGLHVFRDPLLDLLDQLSLSSSLPEAGAAPPCDRGRGGRPGASRILQLLELLAQELDLLRVQPPAILDHPCPGSRARDEDAVDVVEPLPAQPDLECRALLTAGRIGVADVGPDLRGRRGGHGQRRGQPQPEDRGPLNSDHHRLPSGEDGYMISVRRPADFAPSDAAGSTWASRPIGCGSLALGRCRPVGRCCRAGPPGRPAGP